MSSETPQLADDLLHGADAIACFLYGNTTHRMKVYHLVRQRRLPVFRIGVTICARKSRLLTWVEQQEIKSATVEQSG